jgi:pimeloyl-ACP methyl ester carboxylesterase
MLAFTKRRALRLTVALTLAAAGGYAAISAYTALRITRPVRRPFARTPADFGLPFAPVRFSSRVDNIPLDGWLLSAPGEGGRRPVIVVHGRANDRQGEAGGRVLEIAAALVGAGHPVLLFDLRGSGLSGGVRYTLGAREVRDLGGAIDYLIGRGLAPDGVGVLGFSMGAATTLLLAANEPLVRAVAVDSGYAALAELLRRQVPRLSGLPRIFTPGTLLFARRLTGVRAASIRPVDAVPALAARGVPLLVIHGEEDAVVPVAHGRRIAEAYGASVLTYYVAGAAHVAAYAAGPDAYLERLLAFFAAEGGPAGVSLDAPEPGPG